MHGHSGNVSHAEFSPDGTMITTCAMDGRVILWDAQTGQKKASLTAAEDDELHRLDWSPDGRLLATAMRLEHIIIWDAKVFTSLREISGSAPVCLVVW